MCSRKILVSEILATHPKGRPVCPVLVRVVSTRRVCSHTSVIPKSITTDVPTAGMFGPTGSTFSRTRRSLFPCPGGAQTARKLARRVLRLCPDCGVPGRLLVTASEYAIVDYYRCDGCGQVWMYRTDSPEFPPNLVTTPRSHRGETRG